MDYIKESKPNLANKMSVIYVSFYATKMRRCLFGEKACDLLV